MTRRRVVVASVLAAVCLSQTALASGVALAVPATTDTPDVVPPAPAAAAPRRAIDGPDEVVLGRPARVHVTGADRAARYRWDADNLRGFETDSGASPVLDLAPRQGGPLRVRVEVRLGDGTTRTLSRTVRVLRPDVAALRLTPADPEPGDRVRLTLAGRSDSGGFAAYAWDVEGVAARHTRLDLGASRGASRGDLRRARAAAAGTLGGYVDTSGAGLDVTVGSSISIRMPDGKNADGRTIDITAYAVGDAGQVVELHRTVTLDTALHGFGRTTSGVVDCGDVSASAPSWPCAQVASGTPYPVVGYPAVFYDVTPEVQVCHAETTQKPAAIKTRRTELLDLGYPAASRFLGNIAVNPVVGGLRTGRTSRTDASVVVQRRGVQKCEKRGAVPVRWSFGDGTTIKAPGNGTENLPVGHTYAKTGTYQVTLTTKVPYLSTSTKPKDGGTPSVPVYDGVGYFMARTTMSVTVTKPYCGTLSVRGIPVRSVAVSDGTPGCFSVRRSVDGSHDVYQPTDDYAADVNGLRVYRTKLGSITPPLVDPTLGTLSGFSDMGGWVPVASSGPLKRLQVFEGPVLAVPPLALDPRVGRKVAALPGHDFLSGRYMPAPFLSGLRVMSAQALLSPDPAHPSIGVASLRLPAPIGGYADALTDGSTPANGPGAAGRAAAPAADTGGPYDVQADLSGVDLGGIGLRSGTLRHRVSGGWEAGIVLDVPGLGTVDAPFEPAGQSGSRCTETFGPSGLELTDQGGFVSGGAQVDFPAGAEPVLGPVSLGCVALKAQAATGGNPFALIGLAQAHLPPEGPITVDGCAGLSLVGAGQTSDLCGEELVAPADLARLTATADISIYNGLLELGDGSADLVTGPGGARVTVEGHVSEGVGPFSISGSVKGQASYPPAAFYLLGKVEVCAFFCPDGQAGVGTEGFGACASVGGFFYYWDDRDTDFFAFSCDLEPYLSSQRAIARRNDLPLFRGGQSTPRAGATSLVVPVPAGQSKVAIAVHRVDALTTAPEVTLVSPSGRTYVTPAPGVTIEDNPNADGVLVQRFEGEEVGTGITTFTVPTPEAGDWTVRGDGRTEITAELATPRPAPTLSGGVTLSGRRATLDYQADLAPDETLRLIESGAQGERTLGVLTGDQTRLAIPTGPRGRRTITAVVERDGVPILTRVLDRYDAPGLPALAAPTGVAVAVQDGTVRVRWNPVPGATEYDVSARLADGRLVRLTTTGRSVGLPGSSRFTDGTVRVVARAGTGRDSPLVSRPLSPVRLVRIAL